MVIIPLVDLYATACDWWPTGEGAPSGLFWFLVVSYFNGMVIEMDHPQGKIRVVGTPIQLGETAHFDGYVPAFGSVIDPRKNVAMNVNHGVAFLSFGRQHV